MSIIRHSVWALALLTLTCGSASGQTSKKIILEGERYVHSVKTTAGSVKVQKMSPYGRGWSGNAQLLWLNPGVRHRLSLRFRCARPGRYRLIGHFTKGPRYGTFATSFNGQLRRPVFRGAARCVRPSGPVNFGIVEVRPGVNRINLRMLRCRGRALVGIDRFVLCPVGVHAELRKFNEALQEVPRKPWLDPGPKKPGIPQQIPGARRAAARRQ